MNLALKSAASNSLGFRMLHNNSAPGSSTRNAKDCRKSETKVKVSKHSKERLFNIIDPFSKLDR